ncbi:hypothetical protein [Flavobacterium sp. LC2016-12]|uniref:hypothetical protein n=1 Tax=Flavobacterium sp. LC2016-12 TaxID=2783794 RepID=UPI00188BDB21|nr:hypothetical protein [Flavobacterium sp. LC2016-12]MBF4465157.1 hypothetical protein [Flavobacterium sp. LC2016-12]
MKSILPFLIILIFTSCRKENTVSKEIVIPKSNNSVVKKDNLKVIDTTIILSNIPNSNDNCISITELEVEKYLYKYFKSQGALPRNEIKDYSNENMCIDYDTIYNLKSNKTCSAIVRYWLKPVDLNGTCVQPSLAIISKTKQGLILTNKEFVNSDFGIDSIAENLIVYAYKYNCSEHKVLKNYKLKLGIK